MIRQQQTFTSIKMRQSCIDNDDPLLPQKSFLPSFQPSALDGEVSASWTTDFARTPIPHEPATNKFFSIRKKHTQTDVILFLNHLIKNKIIASSFLYKQ
jgi:hypothetical protein